METVKTSKGTFLFVPVHESGVIFYENMGYLIYKEPAYENYCPDEVLADPFKLDKWLKKNEDKSDYKQVAIKLPEGNYKFIAVLKSGLLDTHESSQNITEKTASEIMGDNGKGLYETYGLYKNNNRYACTTAIDAFSALLFQASNSIKPECNYAILKLQE